MRRYPPRRCEVCGKTLGYTWFAEHQRVMHGLEPRRTAAAKARADDLALFIEIGETLDAACARLGTNRDALWVWCRRNGQLDMYERLAARQRRAVNQYTATRRAA